MEKTLAALALATFMIGSTSSTFAQTVMHDHNFSSFDGKKEKIEQW